MYITLRLTELFEGNKIYHFQYLKLCWCRSLTTFLMEDKDQCIQSSQCQVCWCPGDARSQDIIRQGIDLVLAKYPGPSIQRVNTHMEMHKWEEHNNIRISNLLHEWPEDGIEYNTYCNATTVVLGNATSESSQLRPNGNKIYSDESKYLAPQPTPSF